jgi:diacylglycerol kinase (ATP)
MNEHKKILAIINPISGTKNKHGMPKKIESKIDKENFDLTIEFTERAGHATELAHKAIADGFHAVIAVGGDGTVNEVAAALRDSQTALGIIPCGSGNGLARHLDIPLKVEEALEIINKDNIENIDYCTANERPFFCTCGVGFDAIVSAKFAQAGKRGPMTYVQSALTEYLKYRSKIYVIDTPDSVLTEKAFIIACGNASQYGNNAFIAPQASLQDGLIDVTVIHPFTPLDTPLLGILLFTKHIDQDTNIHSFRTPELTIHCPEDTVMHLDGDPISMPANIHIKCHKAGLKAVLPKAENAKRSLLSPIGDGFWDFINAIRSGLNI